MAQLSEITAAVLAGGLGTRLREVVADRPKVLAEVNGRPFLAYLLDRIADAGIRRVVLCTGYMAERVCDAFGGSYREMELCYSQEVEPLGTGGALRLALPFLSSNPLLVMNGDSFCDADLGVLLDRHIAALATASLTLVRVVDSSRYGSVDTKENGEVTNFTEKGLRQGEGIINAGIYLLDRTVVAAIPEGRAVSLEREVFPHLISKGLYGFYQHAGFIDIGVPSDYQAAAAVLSASHHLVSSGDVL